MVVGPIQLLVKRMKDGVDLFKEKSKAASTLSCTQALANKRKRSIGNISRHELLSMI
jgi:hypothetical protein